MGEFADNDLLNRAFPGEGFRPTRAPLKAALEVAYENAAAQMHHEHVKEQDENRIVDNWDDEEYHRAC